MYMLPVPLSFVMNKTSAIEALGSKSETSEIDIRAYARMMHECTTELTYVSNILGGLSVGHYHLCLMRYNRRGAQAVSK